jgi:hypothetical protein
MARLLYTIECDPPYGVAVYEWGTYERSSVLAGQERKSFVDGFLTVVEALAVYPKASVMDGVVSASWHLMLKF